MNPTTENPSVAGDGRASLRDRVQALRLPPRVDAAGRSGGGWLPWLLCLLLAGALGTFGFRALANRTPEAAAPTEKKPAEPTPGDEVVLQAKGYIVPAHQIQVSPIEVSGQVKKLAPRFEEGARFGKGEPLAWLDDTSYQQDVAEARNFLQTAECRLRELETSTPLEEAQAHARLDSALAKLRYARQTKAREEALIGRGGTEEKLEAARSDMDVAEKAHEEAVKALETIRGTARKMRIAAAKFEVEQAKARLARAEWRLGNCVIRAPIAGTILTKKAELGNLVSPLSFNVSASLCEMADLSDLEVDLGVQERDVSKVEQYQRCRVHSEAYPTRFYDGYVDRLMPIANRSKAEVPVRIKVKIPREEEGRYLKPEMGAVVSFYKDTVTPPGAKESAGDGKK
jgi:multidrug resistance efflux pump